MKTNSKIFLHIRTQGREIEQQHCISIRQICFCKHCLLLMKLSFNEMTIGEYGENYNTATRRCEENCPNCHIPNRKTFAAFKLGLRERSTTKGRHYTVIVSAREEESL